MPRLKRCNELVEIAERAVGAACLSVRQPRAAAVYGDDPCQGIRDALATEQAAIAILQAAVTLAQAVEMQLQVDLIDCENPAP